MGNREHNMGLALVMTVEPEQNAEARSYTLFTNYSVRRPTFKNNCLQFTLHSPRLICQWITNLRFFTVVNGQLLRELLHDKI